MKILAVIPARGGSKRLPGKNLRSLGGRPLLAWSVEAAAHIPEICQTIVSTDEPAIAEVARHAGALVPWLRPAELATDSATSVDVCIHALDWYEAENGAVEGMLLLQPTSPFRSRAVMRHGVELFLRHGRRPVVGLSPAQSHPLWCFRLEGEGARPYIDGGGLTLRSQDLPPAYIVNGAFYLISPADLRKRRSFFGDDMVALKMERPEEAIDIDTEWDWMQAESCLSSREVVE